LQGDKLINSRGKGRYSQQGNTGHFDTGHLLSGFTPHSTLSFLQSSTTNPVYFTSQVPSVKFAQLSREINNLSKKDKAFGEISN